jgi:hypothetical protein
MIMPPASDKTALKAASATWDYGDIRVGVAGQSHGHIDAGCRMPVDP